MLSRTRQDTELFRIDDIALAEPIGMRMVGHAILYLRSTDRTTPENLTVRDGIFHQR